MFQEILTTLIQALFVFSVLVIAFALSFYILMCQEENAEAYRSPSVSMVTTVIMMLGNINYVDTWVLPSTHGGLQYNIAYVMLLVFVLFMPILLINLLIGLAVGDIEAVQRNARLKRIAMQLWTQLTTMKRSASSEHPSAFTHSSDNHVYVHEEVNTQTTRRLKQLSKDLHRHTELLLMIVQKLDILTDDDEDVDYIECDGHGSASGAERLSSVTTKKHGVQEVTVSKQ
ncbi:Transient receptor potential cation channel subfamily A member 1 [Lamellibrachia satsuma]|nr:Transient receptor potential cation channel subfamily A member 1 [Lamellibrachia satsuma]